MMLPGILKIRKYGKTSEISLPDFDFEYKLWKNELAFMSKQLRLFQQRIDAIKVEYAHEKDIRKANPALALISPILQSIDQLLSNIKTQEEEIAHYVKDFPINRNHVYYQERNSLKTVFVSIQQEYRSFTKFLKVNLSNLLFI
ncbi:MAG: hypothetical protein K9H64_16395 [Bacteroidales bacterium]|nr:hypothetical protein [Bacteroidales bacterium]MCF8457550.1 hypothetical protein [Bacteroidales bacterium]